MAIPSEPIRILPSSNLDKEGNIRATATLTPKEHKTRGAIAVPPEKVIPIIVIAGIMGSNLRAKLQPQELDNRNRALNPGVAAWRPPNGRWNGYKEAGKWEDRDSVTRQLILQPSTLEVDPGGDVAAPDTLTEEIVRQRGWGEIHQDSYGELLKDLQAEMNSIMKITKGKREISSRWSEINGWQREKWGTVSIGDASVLNEKELVKAAGYQYPVYGFGYNWLLSNNESAEALKKRILTIIEEWKEKKCKCDSVLLVTHSMGGLVARACSLMARERILGVIHAVMPALGAPVCYRRLACGTESSSPTNDSVANLKAKYFSVIAGNTPQLATPVLATSPGPLELLPNQLYPRPWLYADYTIGSAAPEKILLLPPGNPYDLYRDKVSWYRPINLRFADPARLYGGDISRKVDKAIDAAERFHLNLSDHYHPNSFAFYADDEKKLSFGAFHWVAEAQAPIRAASLERGTLVLTSNDGARKVGVDYREFRFSASQQDVNGDGTVPFVSGRAPEGKIRQLFRTTGYDHQGCFGNKNLLNLTLHLLAKLVQKASI
jgi:pimeloyl-ACP methyl ester carboxylesterase